MKFSEIQKTKKKVKLNEIVNDAIVMGKKVWRKHLTSTQALAEIPLLLQKDIGELTTIIESFYADGGDIEHKVNEDGMHIFTTSFQQFKWTTVYDKDEKEVYKAIEVYCDTKKIPKDVTDRIALVIMAHQELPRRKYAQEHFEELVAYLDDSDTKDGIENMLDTFGDNDMLMFSAVTASKGVFEVDVEGFLETLK